MTARPAGRGSGRVTSMLWKRRDGDVGAARLIWRRSWRRAKHRPPPAESPASTTFDAGIGACSESGGGYRRERYAVKASKSAAGKGC